MDHERNRHIYETELRDWLPDTILDAHIHLIRRQDYPPDFRPKPKSYYTHLPGQSYTLEQCKADAARMLPGKRFLGLCFGSPSIEVDRDRANRYIASIADDQQFFGLAMVSPEDPIERVHEWITQTALLGYKPYRNFVTGKPAEAVSLPDMLPAEQMELAQELGLLVMLHIPRARRLADPDNQREICALADRYPRVRIVLAHVGRAYYLSNVVGQLDEIRERPNVYVDVAMLNHWEVLEYVFHEFPRDRILFGTDMPVSCFGGKSVEVNDQYAYVVEQDLDIGSSIYDARHAVQFTYFHYEELRAIRKAAERAGLTRGEIEGLFSGNAMRLLRAVIANRA